jgi:hypothetical protein
MLTVQTTADVSEGGGVGNTEDEIHYKLGGIKVINREVMMIRETIRPTGSKDIRETGPMTNQTLKRVLFAGQLAHTDSLASSLVVAEQDDAVLETFAAMTAAVGSVLANRVTPGLDLVHLSNPAKQDALVQLDTQVAGVMKAIGDDKDPIPGVVAIALTHQKPSVQAPRNGPLRRARGGLGVRGGVRSRRHADRDGGGRFTGGARFCPLASARALQPATWRSRGHGSRQRRSRVIAIACGERGSQCRESRALGAVLLRPVFWGGEWNSFGRCPAGGAGRRSDPGNRGTCRARTARMSRVTVGTGLYGKCDQVEGVGHVAHRFFHIGFSPLIPLGSVFVFDRDESMVEVPFSFKAMLFGYLRAFFLWCLGISGLVAVFSFVGDGVTLNLADGPLHLTPAIGGSAIGVVVFFLVLLVLSYVAARPSAARKAKLLDRLRQAGALR